MTTNTNAKPPDSSSGHAVQASDDDELEISILGSGGITTEKGAANEWVKALQKYRREIADRHELMKSVVSLNSIATLWGKGREWVKEVGLLWPKESDRAITLVVIAEADSVNAEMHLDTSRFGLALGGVFRLIIEPRLLEGEIEERPAGWLLAYRRS